jgi:hypothetical protein
MKQLVKTEQTEKKTKKKIIKHNGDLMFSQWS